MRPDGGAGLVSTLAGTLAFLMCLLLAAHVLVHLFASSFVNAAAFDAARVASGTAGADPTAARAHGLAVLGDYADRVTTFAVHVGDDVVMVVVEADSPALLPRGFGRMADMASIRRTVTLRREQPTCSRC